MKIVQNSKKSDIKKTNIAGTPPDLLYVLRPDDWKPIHRHDGARGKMPRNAARSKFKLIFTIVDPHLTTDTVLSAIKIRVTRSL